MDENENFLERWSRRKSGSQDKTDAAQIKENASEDKSAAPPQEPAAGPDEAASAAEDQAQQGQDPQNPSETTEPQEPAPWENVDIESLTKDSDYTVFMAEGVPENVQKEALDKLWRSDPVLANLDGLNDYDDDYSKWGMVSQVVKTAYKVGQGYLTDEEVAANKAEIDEREKREKLESEEQQIATDETPVEAGSKPEGDVEHEDEQTAQIDDDDQPKDETGIIDDEPDEVV